MTFTDVIVSVVILGLFLSGFSQTFLPVYKARERIIREYKNVNAIRFISESFTVECGKTKPDIENWKRMAGSINELESLRVTEIMRDDLLYALKAVCVVSGENIEIIGVCP